GIPRLYRASREAVSRAVVQVRLRTLMLISAAKPHLFNIPDGAGDPPMFNIVLVEPEIPPNTGNVGRLCLATRSTLHLIGPLGFSLDDRQLKRAGLDYWEEVELREWSTLDELQKANASARFFYLTTKSKQPYFDIRFRPRDFLVFGRETKGLPEGVLNENRRS